MTSGFHTAQHDILIDQEWIERPHRVASPTNAGDHCVRQFALQLPHLLLYLVAYYTLEIPHHHREWLWADHRAYEIISGVDVCNPIAYCLVDGVLERLAARLDWMDLGAKQLHSKNVELLPLDVLGSHVDFSIMPENRAVKCRSDSMLAGACLCDYPLLAHLFCQEGLAESVVGFVGTTVQKVLPFQVNLGATDMLCEVLGKIKRRRPAGVFGQVV